MNPDLEAFAHKAPLGKDIVGFSKLSASVLVFPFAFKIVFARSLKDVSAWLYRISFSFLTL